jgi:glycosyltransferase involved in cell wall biosynthesis
VAFTILSVAYPLSPVAPDTAGGAEQVLLQLDRALVAAGHRSLVIACEGSQVAGTLLSVPKPEGVLNDSAKSLAQHRHARAIRQAIGRFRVDLIHLHGIDFHTYLPPPGVPVLATLHLPLSWYPDAALHPARPDTWLHCVSDTQHATRPETVFFLPPIENGVEVNHRRSNGPGEYALYLGRICPEKGVHLAIDAAKQARFPLIIAGAVFPYREHLDYFAQQIERRLDAQRRFVGSIGPTAKEALLANARCLLVPSLVEETSSLVAREALAAGTPVVAFPRAALAALIEPGRTGFVADDIESMAAAISAAGTLSREACVETARRRFPLSRMIQAYFGAYAALATGGSKLATGAA